MAVVPAAVAPSVKLVTDPPLALCAVMGAQAVAELSIAMSCSVDDYIKWKQNRQNREYKLLHHFPATILYLDGFAVNTVRRFH